MDRIVDRRVAITHTTVEKDSTGVYQFWWYNDTRVAMKRLEDYNWEVRSS